MLDTLAAINLVLRFGAALICTSRSGRCSHSMQLAGKTPVLDPCIPPARRRSWSFAAVTWSSTVSGRSTRASRAVSTSSKCALSGTPDRISCLIGPMISTTWAENSLHSSAASGQCTLLRRRRAREQIPVSTGTLMPLSAFACVVVGTEPHRRRFRGCVPVQGAGCSRSAPVSKPPSW